MPVWSVQVKRGAVARKKMAVDNDSYDKQYQEYLLSVDKIKNDRIESYFPSN